MFEDAPFDSSQIVAAKIIARFIKNARQKRLLRIEKAQRKRDEAVTKSGELHSEPRKTGLFHHAKTVSGNEKFGIGIISGGLDLEEAFEIK